MGVTISLLVTVVPLSVVHWAKTYMSTYRIGVKYVL